MSARLCDRINQRSPFFVCVCCLYLVAIKGGLLFLPVFMAPSLTRRNVFLVSVRVGRRNKCVLIGVAAIRKTTDDAAYAAGPVISLHTIVALMAVSLKVNGC